MSNPTQNEAPTAAGTTYDETPYPSAAFPQTHPAKLAAIGRLFGLTPVPPAQATVLELGCADGANLLPMAQQAPAARFLGIDASAKQVEAGQAAIAAAGLTNVEIRRQDILDFPESEGKFDYIIVHGIFSWVADPVRKKILEICRRHLSPAGIAFVSYNAFPGWGMRMALREMLLMHTGGIKDPKEKVRQARALTAFLAESVPTEKNPYGLLLKQELERMKGYSDNYLRHDILEEVNQPFYFHQFIGRARDAGLQYLGEPALEQMLASNFPKKVQETLEKIGNNLLVKEQYMDFVRNRNFRQTLLVQAEAKLTRKVSPQVLKEFSFVSLLTPSGNGSIDLKPGVEQTFGLRTSAATLKAKDPFLKAVFAALARHSLHRISFSELLNEARQATASYGGDKDPARRAAIEEATLLQNLMQLYSRGMVDAFADRPALLTHVPAKPAVTPLARYQALNARQVTSLTHHGVTLDLVARYVASVCDGTRDRSGILDALVEFAKQDKIRVLEKDQPVQDEARIRAALDSRLDVVLGKLAEYGFFPAT